MSVVAVTLNPLFSQWMQIGVNIDGEVEDFLGWSVSLSSDGSRVAMGAPKSDKYEKDAGFVRVYDLIGENWIQAGNDIYGESVKDQLGGSISLSLDGNRLAIGATQLSAGYVRVYEWQGEEWIQMGADIMGEADDWLGYAVSLSSDGNRLAIGAPNHSSGRVPVYEWQDGEWMQMGTDINGEAVGDWFGYTVSLSSDGDRLAIGARLNDGNGNNSGHARVYEWFSGEWIQMGADIDGEEVDDLSSHVSLSSDGNRLAIGASANDGNGNNSGHVRVYEWFGGEWIQMGADIDGEEAESSSDRVSLSSDGNRLAIGGPTNDGNGNNSGHVRIYEWFGGEWIQMGSDIDGEEASDWFGWAVSLSSDGDRLAVGAPLSGYWNGYVRVFGKFSTSVKSKARKNEVVVFPNPSSGIFYIQGNSKSNWVFHVKDIMGNPIVRQNIFSNGQFDLSALPSGVYILELKGGEQMIVKRILKE